MSRLTPEKDSKIHFNYNGQEKSSFISSNSQIGNPSPYHSRIRTVQINNQQFVPKIIQSGYIVGPPVAYTKDPNLPGNFNAFSPSGRTSSILAQSSNNIQRDFSPHRSRSITPTKTIVNAQPAYIPGAESRISQPPQIVVNPPTSQPFREEMVSKMTYEHCVTECKNWQTKYNQLYLKYMNQSTQNNSDEVSRLKEDNLRLKQRIRDLESREHSKEHTFVNTKDLIDRYKESTLKEMYLLVDRYRLECRNNER